MIFVWTKKKYSSNLDTADRPGLPARRGAPRVWRTGPTFNLGNQLNLDFFGLVTKLGIENTGHGGRSPTVAVGNDLFLAKHGRAQTQKIRTRVRDSTCI